MTAERDSLWGDSFFSKVAGFRPAKSLKLNFVTGLFKGFCCEDKFLKKKFYENIFEI